ncbi:hypothetical protein [Corynebacterium doosanense]|uniref:Membrane protein n=1 Tax=Corynebacterium doosanense CAU 212 = DSM 45436 TaxID=558173 RepID=A0A097IDM4_9CORY|nr:hypothetical protein [Corynebacterium doosanense]AIT60220.1 membrane protein [Corynebacterium doosanense CAU 212 = DSM 45436]
MADEKQLTVAELLARNRQGGEAAASAGTGEQPKRRRRRSLEDGGVSVAELTGSFKAVKASPVESRHSSVPLDEPAAQPVKAEPVKAEPVKAVPAKAAPSNDDTGVIDRVVEKPRPVAKGKPAVQDTTETGVLPRVEAPATAPAPAPADIAPERVEEPVAPDAETEGGSGVGAAVVLAIVGIVIGIVLFLLFQALWARLDVWLVVVLALVVTAALVAVTHRLRTASDGLSMTLAGLVGLVLTFGPAALVLF